MKPSRAPRDDHGSCQQRTFGQHYLYGQAQTGARWSPPEPDRPLALPESMPVSSLADIALSGGGCVPSMEAAAGVIGSDPNDRLSLHLGVEACTLTDILRVIGQLRHRKVVKAVPSHRATAEADDSLAAITLISAVHSILQRLPGRCQEPRRSYCSSRRFFFFFFRGSW